MYFYSVLSCLGLYTCAVTNVRGGNVVITKLSKEVVVVVEAIEPLMVRGYPVYNPRVQVKRQKWTLYSCIYGTFTKGKVDGIVTIVYQDKSKYEVSNVERGILSVIIYMSVAHTYTSRLL